MGDTTLGALYEEHGRGSEPLPDGTEDNFVVLTATTKKSQNGKDMINIQCGVQAGANKGPTVWHRFSDLARERGLDADLLPPDEHARARQGVLADQPHGRQDLRSSQGPSVPGHGEDHRVPGRPSATSSPTSSRSERRAVSADLPPPPPPAPQTAAAPPPPPAAAPPAAPPPPPPAAAAPEAPAAAPAAETPPPPPAPPPPRPRHRLLLRLLRTSRRHRRRRPQPSRLTDGLVPPGALCSAPRGT